MDRIRLDSSCNVVECIADFAQPRLCTLQGEGNGDSAHDRPGDGSAVTTRRRRGGHYCSEPHLTCVSLSPRKEG
jgi:hypothetical protein